MARRRIDPAHCDRTMGKVVKPRAADTLEPRKGGFRVDSTRRFDGQPDPFTQVEPHQGPGKAAVDVVDETGFSGDEWLPASKKRPVGDVFSAKFVEVDLHQLA